jgi:hypothetical protein
LSISKLHRISRIFEQKKEKLKDVNVVATKWEFNIGDVVEPNEPLLKLAPDWKGAKFELLRWNMHAFFERDVEVHVKLIQLPLSGVCIYKVGDEIPWYAKYLKLGMPSSKTLTRECDCQIDILMAKGCQCGGT